MAQSMFNLKKQNEQRPHTNNLFVWGGCWPFLAIDSSPGSHGHELTFDVNSFFLQSVFSPYGQTLVV